MKQALDKIFTSLFNFLMPANPTAKKLAEMKPEDFADVVAPSSDNSEHITSLYSYRDPLARELIWQMKFKHNSNLTNLGANLLYDSIVGFMQDSGNFSGFENPLIIPVPISKKRERERGFNQSALLARKILELDDGANFEIDEHSVAKTLDTVPQTTLIRAEREKNLVGCFTVTEPEKIKGRNIIIIDDVYTTGSTINELKKVLVQAGAKKVVGFTIAH
jgi:ComF family protein